MSGLTGNTKCGKCGELAEFYVESPPVPCLIVSCTNYECGFKYYLEDGKDISYYQEKSEIKDLREILIEEIEENEEKDMKFEIDINDDQSIRYSSNYHMIDEFKLMVRRTSRNGLLSDQKVIDQIQNTLDHYCDLTETQNAEFILYK